jgi:hypothetical protein
VVTEMAGWAHRSGERVCLCVRHSAAPGLVLQAASGRQAQAHWPLATPTPHPHKTRIRGGSGSPARGPRIRQQLGSSSRQAPLAAGLAAHPLPLAAARHAGQPHGVRDQVGHLGEAELHRQVGRGQAAVVDGPADILGARLGQQLLHQRGAALRGRCGRQRRCVRERPSPEWLRRSWCITECWTHAWAHA